MRNDDSEFSDLLKLCFGIDGIYGQLIIVTHSTDALIGDYRNLVRFYQNEDKTEVISGYTLQPDKMSNNHGGIRPEDEKHLIMHFPEIKEAFYSKCAILIEGETEYGCIHAFAEKIDVSLDDYGICVINARGEGSIAPLRQLLAAFSIPSIAIYDGDVKTDQAVSVYEFYTNEPCFEIEIVKNLYSKDNAKMIRKIALELDKRAEVLILDEDFVRKPFKKMGVDLTGYIQKRLSDVNESDEDEFCHMYSAWFMVKKRRSLGKNYW